MRYIGFTISLMMLSGLLFWQPVIAQHDSTSVIIQLIGRERITAGDAWQLQIRVSGVEAGDTVQATLHHGLRYRQDTLQLGSGGMASWHFAAGELNQAGTTVISVSNKAITELFTLQVEPAAPETLTAFTTDNSLAAYGEEVTSLLALVSDAHGNPIREVSGRVYIRAPDGRSVASPELAVTDGTGQVLLRSRGNPGLLRMTVVVRGLVQQLTLLQHAGMPDRMRLSVTPECVLADGRDTVTLTADVRDSAGFAVPDSTRVLFRWDNGGQATGTVINGQATVRLPPPQQPGTVHFEAFSGNQQSATTLTVARSACR